LISTIRGVVDFAPFYIMNEEDFKIIDHHVAKKYDVFCYDKKNKEWKKHKDNYKNKKNTEEHEPISYSTSSFVKKSIKTSHLVNYILVSAIIKNLPVKTCRERSSVRGFVQAIMEVFYHKSTEKEFYRNVAEISSVSDVCKIAPELCRASRQEYNKWHTKKHIFEEFLLYAGKKTSLILEDEYMANKLMKSIISSTREEIESTNDISPVLLYSAMEKIDFILEGLTKERYAGMPVMIASKETAIVLKMRKKYQDKRMKLEKLTELEREKTIRENRKYGKPMFDILVKGEEEELLNERLLANCIVIDADKPGI